MVAILRKTNDNGTLDTMYHAKVRKEMKMKKLMVMSAIVAGVTAVQAGRVTWGSGDLFTAGTDGTFTSTIVGDGTVSGYLWLIDATTFNSYYSTYESSGYAAMAEALYSSYGEKTDTASKSGTSSGGGLNLSDNVTYSKGTDVYAAVLYTMTQDGTDYYIANIGDFRATSAAKTVYDMAAYQLGGGTSGTDLPITGWTAISGTEDVPEPTSGLLLVLGGAMLALRRRRA